MLTRRDLGEEKEFEEFKEGGERENGRTGAICVVVPKGRKDSTWGFNPRYRSKATPALKGRQRSAAATRFLNSFSLAVTVERKSCS
jgi:hypothetical protein